MEVEAQDDGVMAKILAEAGTKNVPVNSPIAIIGEEGDDLSGADALAEEATKESSAAEKSEEQPKQEEPKQEAAPPKQEQPKDEKPVPPKQESKTGGTETGPLSRVLSTPAARRLALERGVPLLQIKGSGPEGRVLKEDVEKYTPAAAGGAAPAAAAAAPAAPGAAAPTYEDIPLSNMRRTIAKRLSESKSTVPHYYVSIDVEMDKVSQLRELFNRAAAESAGGDAEKAKAAKLSVNDFIMKAAAIALKQVPSVNSSWHGDFIREYHVQDISMAVSTPTGLITPIVRNVGAIGLTEISSASKSLAKKARDGKLKPEEYQGGTFTISNMGMMGTTHFTAIINPPQSAILALGTTVERIVPDDSERGWRKAQIMQATISSDHRVSDGATSARWMQAFKAALENPLSFML